jgi:GT2 family glycosyltransferase
MDVSIIILSYNSKELLAQTLDSVRSCYDKTLQIETIVSDNGSTDGSVEMVEELYKWVTLVKNGENLGFSAGNNRGVPFATGKYVLFLNSDTVIYPDVLPFMISQFNLDSTLGVATCRVELSDGKIDPACHRGFPTPWRAFCYYSRLEKIVAYFPSVIFLRKLFGGYHLLGEDLTSPHEIDACTGAFLMIPKVVGNEIGWWDEKYFMYGEDLDLCCTAKEKGYKIKYFPNVKILHLKHQSGLKRDATVQKVDDAIDLEKKREIKRKTTIAFYDAMRIFYHKHYLNVYPVFVTKLVLWFVEYKKTRALSKI